MGTDRLIYIRTDGNSQIATGHLVRCLSIANACLSLGMKVHFLVSDKESKELLQVFDLKHKFPVQILETAVYNDLDRELPEVLSLFSSITQNTFPVYFVDSYYVTEKYLSSINAVVPVAYIDDLQLFDYPVNLVINYDVIPESKLPAYKAAYQKAAHTLLGASYTPLRSQFTDLQPRLRGHVSNVLVTTGGSDPCHFCLKLIEALKEKQISGLNDSRMLPSNESSLPPYQLHIVIGRLNKDRELLHDLAMELSFIRLHENVSDMASLMESCDLAISAAGTTLYELCAAGVPSISFCLADNQLTAAKAFDEAGAIPCAGDIRSGCDEVLVKVINFMTDMSENFPKREAAHGIMRQLVDGKGAIRIATALSELS